MATCFDSHDAKSASIAPANFWRGLALGVAIWVVLVSALIIA